MCRYGESIPYAWLESGLFEYPSGAFTGAQQKGKPGKIEKTDDGTLFLDEIGEDPFRAQAKLLRVLDEKWVERMGEVLPENHAGKNLKKELRKRFSNVVK